jgi:hypothetical protein
MKICLLRQKRVLAMKLPLFCVAPLLVLGPSLAVGQVIYNSASTAGEGYQRGMASVIDAQGSRNLSNSQAAINMTDARSNQIDNQVKSVNAYWEKNDIYNQHLQQKNYQIEQTREMLLAKNRLQPLTPEEFDSTTGNINWPKVLTQSQYDQYRDSLTDLFKKRAQQGYLSNTEYVQATQASQAWHKMMVGQSGQYPKGILDQMLRFLAKLNRELNDNLS